MNELIKIAEKECIDIFEKIDEIALYNQQKVLNAFINRRISPRHFQPSYGYGYDDIGREALSALFADIFHTEDALVSPLIANGTHTINLALLGLLRPNDTLLSVSGKPYDTLEEIINGEGIGSLKDFGIKYRQIEYIDNTFDKCKIIDFLCENSVKMVFIQRSKGYLWQNTITVKEIQEIVKEIKDISKDTIILIDNCYGEFTDIYEPTDFGADLVAGSLIKNPGGGFAPTGGYIAGKADLIDLIAKRLTAPSLGKRGWLICGFVFAVFSRLIHGSVNCKKRNERMRSCFKSIFHAGISDAAC